MGIERKEKKDLRVFKIKEKKYSPSVLNGSVTTIHRRYRYFHQI